MSNVAFGPFVLDPVARVLLRGGERISITGKVLDTLILLVENRGRVMSKDELLVTLWPDTTVEEGNLTQNISTVRRLLGDDARQHRYIATVAGRGYSFVAAVTELPDDPERPRTSPRKWIWTVAAVPVLVVLGWALTRRLAPSTLSPRLNAVPLTTYPGVETMPAFSPDGRQVVYVRGEDAAIRFSRFPGILGKTSLYIKLVDAGTELRLTINRSGNDTFPAWSRDGQYIAFYRNDGEASGYYVVSGLGGAERRIPGPVVDNCAGLDWMPDGRALVVSEFSERSQTSPLTVISTDTGERRALTSPKMGVMADIAPAVAPNGESAAFVRVATVASCDLFTVRLATGAVHQVTFDHAWKGRVAWTQDSRQLVGSADMSDEEWPAWRIPVEGGGRVPISLPDRSPTSIAVAPRGNRLAYAVAQGRVSLRHAPLSGSGSPDANPGEEIAATTRSQIDPQYSPDGRKIAFASDRSGSWQIWTANVDDGAVRQITRLSSEAAGSPFWSPDGTAIAFDAEVNGNIDIWLVSADGGAARRLTTHTAEDAVPGWSRDSAWVYFGSNRGGDFNVWKIRPSGESAANAAIRLTRGGGFHPVETADGRFVYFAKGRGKAGLWRVPASGGIEEPVVPSLQNWGWWALSARDVFLLHEDGGNVSLMRCDAAGGCRQLSVLPQLIVRTTGAITARPDGGDVVYTHVDPVGADIMLVENFR